MTKPYHLSKLKNGATLITVPMRETKAATLLVFYPVGSRYESQKLSGASHFIEHLMFKGTKKRPDTATISRELDSVGAEYNAFTGKDHTGYYIKIASEHLPLACDILADMLSNSLFDQREVDRERGVIIEEIHMYEDNPMMHLDDLLEQALYPGSTMGRNIAGTRATMTAMKRGDVIRYRDLFYHPRHQLIVLAGNLPPNTVAAVSKTFGAIRGPRRKAPPAFARVRPSAGRPEVLIKFKDTKQVQAAFGFPSYGHGDKRLPALSLLSVILGGNMSSRLFIQVRERRGLCYYIRAGASPYQDIGTFMIQSGLTCGRIDEALGVILAEVKKIRDEGVGGKELASAKEFIKGKIILDLEETNEVADWYGRQYLFRRKMESPEEKMRRFARVSREQVQAVARDLFREERLRLALIGPFKDKTRFRKLLKL
ncbi:insulinase family protein [Patescibacteria group bacterium]|nr:MAG: insulinase family protein [Patescibacteria group bacterium]